MGGDLFCIPWDTHAGVSLRVRVAEKNFRRKEMQAAKERGDQVILSATDSLAIPSPGGEECSQIPTAIAPGMFGTQ